MDPETLSMVVDLLPNLAEAAGSIAAVPGPTPAPSGGGSPTTGGGGSPPPANDRTFWKVLAGVALGALVVHELKKHSK